MSNGHNPPVPAITVQLVHIEGPLKGEIQEFDDPVITIGRAPDCSVTFPKELKAISRHHAEIRREGNRFKLIDHSTNGTFVQGKRVQEIYLKDGDVITFTEEGPKVSFLSIVKKEKVERPVSSSAGAPSAASPTTETGAKRSEPAQIQPETTAKPAGPVTITIQWGAALKTFRQPSVRLGSDPACDLTTDLPNIAPFHLEIRYQQGNIWVKDLTGESRTLLNGMPLTQSTVLRSGDSLKLTRQGPILEYVGDERFVRQELPSQDAQTQAASLGPAQVHGPEGGMEPPKPPPLRSMPHVQTGIPMWVWVAAGSALLVAIIVYLIVKLTS